MTKFAAYGAALKLGDQEAIRVASATWAAGTATFTTVSAHGWSNGNTVKVVGMSPAGYNNTATIGGAAGSTFTQTIADPGVATAAGTGWAKLADTFATIAQVRTITGPGLAMDTVDVTTHDSTGAWREFVAGLIALGEVSLDVVFDPDNAGHIGLRTDLVARQEIRGFQIVFPDSTATTWSFDGMVTNITPEATVDGALEAAVTIGLSGPGTLA